MQVSSPVRSRSNFSALSSSVMFYSTSESREWCKECDRYVLARQTGPDLLFHLLVSLLCCWPWAFVWLIMVVIEVLEKPKCTRCGASVGGVGGILLALLAPILVVAVLVAGAIAAVMLSSG